MNLEDKMKLADVVDTLEIALDQLREMSHEGYSELMDVAFHHDVPRMIKRAKDCSKELLD